MNNLIILTKIIIEDAIIPILVFQNILSIMIDGITLNKLSKYDGYLIRNHNTLNQEVNYYHNVTTNNTIKTDIEINEIINSYIERIFNYVNSRNQRDN